METFCEHYDSMCSTIQKCLPGTNMDLLRQAVDYAANKHKEQKQKQKTICIKLSL